YIENDQLIFKGASIGRSYLLPISQNEYINLSNYSTRAKFIEERGLIDRVEMYSYDSDLEKWNTEPDTSFVKKVFLN
ncbi:MAG: hypothetical protein KJP00_03355, partial [Bacteroidia bacterium]|nr:hypothetical protein [Bacteroidia bacterium]